MTVGAPVDVHQLMQEIRAEVDRKRQAGLYPPEVLEELDSVLDEDLEGEDQDLSRAMVLLRQSAVFSPTVTTASSIRVVGPAAAAFKKAVRGSTGWYVSAILQQVGQFAGRTIRVLGLLSERLRLIDERVPKAMLDDIRRELAEQRDDLRALGVRHHETVTGRLAAVEAEIEAARARDRLAQLERSVRALQERTSVAGSQSRPEASAPRPSRFTDLEYDYVDFEDRFRGSVESIRERQGTYVELFTGAPGPVVDIGCGRGEFLALLREAGISSFGVDRHPGMVAMCKEAGLDAREADALSYLASAPAGSLGGLFSAQTIEHLDVRDVPKLFELAADAIAPGGRLVIETINPESLFVFAAAFYVDLGHLRPLHALTLQFLADKTGFRDVEVRYSSPVPDDMQPVPIAETGSEPLDRVIRDVNENTRRANSVLFGPQDYAIIATR